MKFHVRNEHGELIVPSYRELRTLYQQRFITDDDEIRRDDTTRWVKAGLMPDLRAIKPKSHPKELEYVWLAVIIAVASVILFLILHK